MRCSHKPALAFPSTFLSDSLILIITNLLNKWLINFSPCATIFCSIYMRRHLRWLLKYIQKMNVLHAIHLSWNVIVIFLFFSSFYSHIHFNVSILILSWLLLLFISINYRPLLILARYRSQYASLSLEMIPHFE